MSKVVVTGIKSYQFTNKDTGEVIEGIKVSFLSSIEAKGTNEKGYLPLQQSVKIDFMENFKFIPGLYDAIYDMVPGKGNKPTLAITEFRPIKEVDLNVLFK